MNTLTLFNAYVKVVNRREYYNELAHTRGTEEIAAKWERWWNCARKLEAKIRERLQEKP